MGSIMTVRLHKHSKGENILEIINGYLVTIYPDWTDCLQLQYPFHCVGTVLHQTARDWEFKTNYNKLNHRHWNLSLFRNHYSAQKNLATLGHYIIPHNQWMSHFSSICNSNNPPYSNNMTIQFSDATDNSSAHIHISSLLLPPNFENASPQQYVEPSINHILRSLKGGEPILPHNRRERRCTVW